jgi:hypothetical protein
VEWRCDDGSGCKTPVLAPRHRKKEKWNAYKSRKLHGSFFWFFSYSVNTSPPPPPLLPFLACSMFRNKEVKIDGLLFLSGYLYPGLRFTERFYFIYFLASR